MKYDSNGIKSEDMYYSARSGDDRRKGRSGSN